ncbi:MAG: hypothetical protein A3J52_00705 [Omnitrophica bacterium RIFCSPHIGHO2_02_FULL_49_9]|nr:MAG: hypothetical protein A3J52_00705 [Omnitrophica bacterium RIFCSPHIGHO2_02_FULL_49_9]OGX05799.1 MAG: hypothetical protein A3G87_10320 [Omnitrophica bacterium RIFCSPLOWO2_12_FULL_50_11]
MNKVLYVLWPVTIFLGGVALCFVKPADVSWAKLGISVLLVLGVSALTAAVLLPFRETKFLSDNFYAAVVSGALSGGLIGLTLLLLARAWQSTGN